MPFDVSEATLREAAGRLADRYPGMDIHGVVGDLDQHLHTIPTDGRRLVAFLGGTIGNYPPAARRTFLADLAATLRPGDHLLLGTDLVKDPARIVAAYDDAAGVTAAFNRNVLDVLNRELDGDFRPERFDHVALWNEGQQWIEMRLRSRRAQTVRTASARARRAVRGRRGHPHRDQRQVHRGPHHPGAARRRSRAGRLVDRCRRAFGLSLARLDSPDSHHYADSPRRGARGTRTRDGPRAGPIGSPEGQDGVRAYILIQTEVRKAASVAHEVRGIDGVITADDVTGPYDVIAVAEAGSVDELGRLVVSRLQLIEGITRTLTCPVVNL